MRAAVFHGPEKLQLTEVPEPQPVAGQVKVKVGFNGIRGTIQILARCEWIKKGERLCLIADSGIGKTHLLIGFGTAAAQDGYWVGYTLVNELVEAADERQLAKTIARYGRRPAGPKPSPIHDCTARSLTV